MAEVAWQPDVIENPATIAELGARYTGRSRAFVVYEFGTLVFSDTNVPRSIEEYDATLLAAVVSPPSFTVQDMQLGNFLVRFKGPVTGLVLGDFYRSHNTEIRNGIDTGGLILGEKVQVDTQSPVPEEHYYIGLYARSKLFADARNLKISEHFSPKSEY